MVVAQNFNMADQKSKRSLRFLILVGALSAIVSANDLNIHLFDLSTDPFEANDLQSSENQVETISSFQEKAIKWSQYFVEPSVVTPYTPAWDECGGVCSWETSDYEPITVEQKYSYSDAPNIVFVLVDDWGWNDLGSRSTYMNWATPNIDTLLSQGVSLSNYYTNELCTPSRASLLTGRYAFKLGMQNSSTDNIKTELSVSEITLAQELQSAGYKTYMIGKWDLGFSTSQHTPTSRGFDYFYGFYNGFEDYWTKEYSVYLDLHENDALVTDESETDSELHSAYLFQTKAESIIRTHASSYADTPMFLYYSMQLVHAPFEAPQVYLDRCSSGSSVTTSSTPATDDLKSDYVNYCAMMVMMDEVVANLTCTLSASGLLDNTVLVISSDNGAVVDISGAAYPYRGAKGSFNRGGVSSTAIVVSNLLSDDMRGSTYDGTMHITDWLPTLMHVATNGSWTSGYSDQDIDGFNLWPSLTGGLSSPRVETPQFIGMSSDTLVTSAVILNGDMKYFIGLDLGSIALPEMVFTEDLSPGSTRVSCDESEALATTVSRSPRQSLSILHDVALKQYSTMSTELADKFVYGVFLVPMLLVLFVGPLVCSKFGVRSVNVVEKDGGEVEGNSNESVVVGYGTA